MQFAPDPGVAALREDVRAFLREHLPADFAKRGRYDYHIDRPTNERWMRILDAKGWAAPHWPIAHGGTGWTPMQVFAFQEELRLAGAPVLDRSALDLVGPVIHTYGCDWQKSFFLPRIRSGKHFWCQGFSEPGAGSDLAHLRTRADLDGDTYVVNGQKTWTSDANWADWIFMLVRTDPQAKAQKGISFLLIDMTTQGVVRRPIRSIDGGITLHEVFFDDVRVPAKNLVGEANMGWAYAKFLLSNERSFSAEVPHSKRDLAQLRQLAGQITRKGRPLDQDPIFAAKMARVEIDLLALEWAVLRVLHAEEGDTSQDAVASVLKLRGSELRQTLAELAAQALGDHGIAEMPDPMTAHDRRPAGAPPVIEAGIGVTHKAMFRRATTIYGGTNEIQRNIIAKSVLGL